MDNSRLIAGSVPRKTASKHTPYVRRKQQHNHVSIVTHVSLTCNTWLSLTLDFHRLRTNSIIVVKHVSNPRKTPIRKPADLAEDWKYTTRN